MKTSKKIMLLAILGLVLGVSLVCFGLIFDPFSLPFQDYELMPPETQQAYEARSTWMQAVRLFGSSLAILALLTIPVTWLVGRTMKV